MFLYAHMCVNMCMWVFEGTFMCRHAYIQVNCEGMYVSPSRPGAL